MSLVAQIIDVQSFDASARNSDQARHRVVEGDDAKRPIVHDDGQRALLEDVRQWKCVGTF